MADTSVAQMCIDRSRCQPTCSAQRDASSGWSSLYPSFWSSIFAKPSPILEMTVDADRGILYTRSENSALQVTPMLQQEMKPH